MLAAQSVIAAFQFSAREGPVKASRGEERGGGAAVVGLGGPEKRRMGKGPREMGEREMHHEKVEKRERGERA